MKMMSIAFAVQVLFLIIAGSVVAQDQKSLDLLSQEIELLKRENEILIRENAMLKKELEKYESDKPEKAARQKAKLTDIFVVGVVFSSKSEHVAGPTRGTTGSGTFTVTSRDGDWFTATNAWTVDQDKSSGTGELKGKITGANTARWRRVDSPLGAETVATLRPDGSYIDTFAKNPKGSVIKGVLKVDK